MKLEALSYFSFDIDNIVPFTLIIKSAQGDALKDAREIVYNLYGRSARIRNNEGKPLKRRPRSAVPVKNANSVTYGQWAWIQWPKPKRAH